MTKFAPLTCAFWCLTCKQGRYSWKRVDTPENWHSVCLIFGRDTLYILKYFLGTLKMNVSLNLHFLKIITLKSCKWTDRTINNRSMITWKIYFENVRLEPAMKLRENFPLWLISLPFLKKVLQIQSIKTHFV